MPYNPASGQFGGPQYTLTGPDGTVYYLSAASGVVQENLPGGQILYYSGSGITSSTGDAVRFIRNAAGRITTIEAPNGAQEVYAYDAQGNLVEAHNTVSGQSSNYGYAAGNPHLLTLATAPAAGSGAAVSYGATTQVTPLTANLGGTSQFLAGNYDGNLAAGATDSFAFLLTASEVASTSTGSVLVGVDIEAAAGSAVQPAVPAIAGLTPLVQHTGPGSAFDLFAISRAGLELLQFAGADAGTTGAYTLQVFIAGDANQDGDVNGEDGTLVASLVGTSVGQPGYSLAADANRDGVIDAADVQLVAANYGFRATQPPVVQAGAVMTHAGLPVQFNLAPQATDPQGQPVFFTIVGADDGTATLNPDGHTVTFIPAAGFTGTADFQFEADDGQEVSTPATITVTVSAAPLVSLDFQTREPRLAIGGFQQIVLVGSFTDQQNVVLDPSYVTYQSTNPAVATISTGGRLVGAAQGTSALVVSAGGLQAATAVTVGVTQDALDQELYNQGLDLYPLSVTLSSTGGTRQLDVHPGDDLLLSTNLAPSVTGTEYFVSQPGVVTVSADGVLTAVAPGTVTVTVIQGPTEARTTVRVQTPQTGTVIVDASGGVVQGSDGSVVAVAPGALSSATPVSITPATQTDLPQAVPNGLTFVGGFNLNVGANELNTPLQLAIPVAVGTPVGSTVYFYRAGQYINDDGTTSPIWWQVESGIVGADGMAHTNSPPQIGVDYSGLYFVGYSQEALADYTLAVDNAQIANAEAGLAAVSLAVAGGGGSLVGVMAAVTAIGINATLAIPAQSAPVPIFTQVLPQVGLPASSVSYVQLAPGVSSFATGPLPVPTPPLEATPPQLTGISIDTNVQPGQTQPALLLTGNNFLAGNYGQAILPTNLVVKFAQPNGVAFATSNITNGTNNSLRVLVPNGVVVGICQITVYRPDLTYVFGTSYAKGYTTKTTLTASNAAQITAGGSYVFVALPEGNNGAGELAVLDGNAADQGTLANPGTFGNVIANIPLAIGSQIPPYPRDVAVTPDNSRAYVTLEGTGQVAVVDALTLQEVDVNAGNILGAAAAPLQPISAGDNGVALDPALRMATLTGPTDIRGTITLPNATWTLQLGLWSTTWQPIATLATGTGTVDSGVLLPGFDPKAFGLPNGFYRLRLTATAGNVSQLDEVYIGAADNPSSKEIALPIGAEPYGIAIDPSGNYAYVADARPYLVDQHSTNGTGYVASEQVSQVYVIDINPASKTYNQVIKTIQLVNSDELLDNTTAQVADPNGLIAPDGLREITVSADGTHVYVAAPNLNPDPNGGPFDDLPGNLIEIDVTFPTGSQPFQVTHIYAYPAAAGTFGVATVPGQTPGTNYIAVTNSQSDANGVEVVSVTDPSASGTGSAPPNQKVVIPFDLDPNDLPSDNQVNEYL